MDSLHHYALAAGLAWASGIRLYAAVCLAGLLGRLHAIELPAGLLLLQDSWVIAVAGALALGEFLADKIPAFDSIWDGVHTFIRIPAGTLLAWGVFKDSAPEMQLAAALVGGAITSGTHFAKAGTRALINTSPEPFSNWSASLTEDVSLLGGLYLVWQYPLAFLLLLLAFLLFVVWLIPKLWRAIRSLFHHARRLVDSDPETR
ncbi:MAG: DUF4126 domain-containing protein [Tahibacter sp.]